MVAGPLRSLPMPQLLQEPWPTFFVKRTSTLRSCFLTSAERRSQDLNLIRRKLGAPANQRWKSSSSFDQSSQAQSGWPCKPLVRIAMSRRPPHARVRSCSRMRRSTQRRSNKGFMTRLLDPATRIHSRFRALQVELAVLEWNLSRSYVWRAGLHAAGSLMIV